MEGILIDLVKYMDGHSRLGNQTFQVNLVAYPTNLTVVRSLSDRAIFSIPWGNLVNVRDSVMEKKGLASAGSVLASAVPLINLTNASSMYHEGIYITYTDEEIQRDQRVFFATGTRRKAERIVRNIIRHRDDYYRSLNRSSGPTRRE